MTENIYIVQRDVLEEESDGVRNERWSIERRRMDLVLSDEALMALAKRAGTVRWVRVARVTAYEDLHFNAAAEAYRQKLCNIQDHAQRKADAIRRMQLAEAEKAKAAADLEEIAAREKGQIP